jgi:hypothetical protein
MTDTTDTVKPIVWAGGTHAMNLNTTWTRAVLSVRGLPGDYGSTPAACFKRFEQGIFSTDDVEQVIYLGLIGGGLSREEADDLVDRHVRSRPVLENSATAFSVLATLFTSDIGDQEGEAA